VNANNAALAQAVLISASAILNLLAEKVLGLALKTAPLLG
jgi:hypothetical protein